MPNFNNRRITALLATFTDKAMREFTAYVKERGKKSNILLWEAVRRTHPKYEIDEKKVFKKIRPGQPFKDKNYRVSVSELTQLAKEFIAIEAFREEELDFNNKLSLELLKRRMKEMALKVLDKNSQVLKERERHCSLYYDCLLYTSPSPRDS